ncbi:MAG: tRNA methyl transferase PRC-barrel domain-containing protein, partial [Pleurocapsa sp.]
FLYDLTQELLAGSVFPLGNQTKDETRRVATEFNLATAEKPESQDLCLVEAHGNMQTFLDRFINQKEGDIVDMSGNVLGKHTGIHHYTIGQRRGLGIAAPNPLYVGKLDAVMNRVIVGERNAGGRLDCTVNRMNWVSIAEPTSPIKAEVKIRYRSKPVVAQIIPLGDSRIKIMFEEHQFGVTPGQAAVLYSSEMVLGGGIIEVEKAEEKI